MTALLWEAPATTRVQAPARHATWPRTRSGARACTEVGRPRLQLVVGGLSAPDAAPGRLYWTRRGLAVALALVAVVVGIMAGTVVAAFLAVSNEPLIPGSGPAVVPAHAFAANSPAR